MEKVNQSSAMRDWGRIVIVMISNYGVCGNVALKVEELLIFNCMIYCWDLWLNVGLCEFRVKKMEPRHAATIFYSFKTLAEMKKGANSALVLTTQVPLPHFSVRLSSRPRRASLVYAADQNLYAEICCDNCYSRSGKLYLYLTNALEREDFSCLLTEERL